MPCWLASLQKRYNRKSIRDTIMRWVIKGTITPEQPAGTGNISIGSPGSSPVAGKTDRETSYKGQADKSGYISFFFLSRKTPNRASNTAPPRMNQKAFMLFSSLLGTFMP